MHYTSYANFSPDLESSSEFMGQSKYNFRVASHQEPLEGSLGKGNTCQWEELYANDSGKMVITGMFVLGKPMNMYVKNNTGTGAFSVLSMHNITEEILPHTSSTE